MRKTLLIVFVSAMFASGIAYSDMESAGHKSTGAMEAQKTQQMMGAQTMHRETVQQMSRMMEQINNMMQDMRRIMDQQKTMDQKQVQDMARIMEHTADNLQEMSRQMTQENISAEDRDKLQKRMAETEQMMNQVRQASLPPADND